MDLRVWSRFFGPCTGAISYELFSTSISSPKIYLSWTGGKGGLIADILWFNAHLGFGTYIFRQKFVRRTNTACSITYSAFCTVMFNFGSALIWGTVRTLLPAESNKLKLCFGLASGLLFLCIGNSFLNFLNSLCH